jgi:hypothetical protein
MCFCDICKVYRVEVYARVRQAVQVEGMSLRHAAREFGLPRKTIRKMLAFSVPSGYQRKKPLARPKLGPWLGIIDQIQEEDEARPKKQRHTARRIYNRLAEGRARLHGRLHVVHPPGVAQADFGEASAVFGGVEQKAQILCVDLPHSEDAFYDSTSIAVKEITGDGGGSRPRSSAG